MPTNIIGAPCSVPQRLPAVWRHADERRQAMHFLRKLLAAITETGFTAEPKQDS